MKLLRARRREPDHLRLSQYVEEFFRRSGNTDWPTVRQAARALRWSYRRVEQACDDEPDGQLFTSSYYTTPETPFGEHFIERYDEIKPEIKPAA